MEQLDEIFREKAILVGVHRGLRDILEDSDEQSLKELERLADTAGAEVVAQVLQNRPSLESATYIGEGKLQEVKQLVQSLEAELVIFDDELSGAQVRNLDKVLGVKVLDRSMLILDIFATRATSKEGKLQVELAQLNYLLPRLTGMGASLSRLGGGIGTRGPGESQLETDRRHIRYRIRSIEQKLKEAKTHHKLLQDARKKRGTPTVALMGYTNAGKSTLLNALTQAGVLAEDKLFATLDPTARKLMLPDGLEVMIVDTVGFVRKLPHHLVEAFHTTLEETMNADLLLHIVDTSSDEMENQMAVVHTLVSELGGSQRPMLIVYNKIDAVEKDKVYPTFGQEASVFLSAKTGEGLSKLILAIEKSLVKPKQKVQLHFTYQEGSELAELRKDANVLKEEFLEDGVRIDCEIEQQILAKYATFVV